MCCMIEQLFNVKFCSADIVSFNVKNASFDVIFVKDI